MGFDVQHRRAVKGIQPLNLKAASIYAQNAAGGDTKPVRAGLYALCENAGQRPVLVVSGVPGGGHDAVRVNAVSPGIIATPMLAAAMGEDGAAPFGRHAPLRRVGTPEDVADAVAWLLCDDARFVTGQSLSVDGGFTLGGLRPWMLEAAP